MTPVRASGAGSLHLLEGGLQEHSQHQLYPQQVHKLGMGQHNGLDIPYPPKESCPGRDAEEEEVGGATGQGGMVNVPGVLKVGTGTNYLKLKKDIAMVSWTVKFLEVVTTDNLRFTSSRV